MDSTTRSLLRQTWNALGGDSALLDRVSVDDVSPALLPSRFPVVAAGSAAVAASTLAASVLAAARIGRSVEPVSVDPRHVSVALRSEACARLGGRGPGELFAPMSRLWQTSDGWIRLHANYSWHREHALAVLGCAESDVGEAIATWRGEDLEDALAEGGAVGAFVRTPAQWRAHPQGLVVDDLPLLELACNPVSGVPSSRLDGTPNTPAQGLRVLDLTRVIAGPGATRTLAAYGADVLRVDAPHRPELPDVALDTLQGKRSTLLDLANHDDRRRFEELLGQADVLVHGYRPGALEAFGLRADELAVRHPELVVVAISAWGRVGPWAERRGFDSLVQCATGIASTTAAPDGRPGALPAQALDHCTGYLAAAAAMLGVARRAQGFGSSVSTLSLAQTSRWLQRAASSDGSFAPDPVDPADFLVDLPGPHGTTTVVRPPGQVGDFRPFWQSTAAFGADDARWL